MIQMRTLPAATTFERHRYSAARRQFRDDRGLHCSASAGKCARGVTLDLRAYREARSTARALPHLPVGSVANSTPSGATRPEVSPMAITD